MPPPPPPPLPIRAQRAEPDPRPVERSRAPAPCDTSCGAPTVLGARPGSIPFHTLLERVNARARIVEQDETLGRIEAAAQSQPGAPAEADRSTQHAPAPPELDLGWPSIGDAPTAQQTRRVHEIEHVYRVRLGAHRGAVIDLFA